ncbi:hypothetical protein GGS23DRAFT_597845 [Durotheca rogersii]|uniref:uncharacterized protein n=1 Tax=Durotheca rogersii TaxID=419775 RepID=UPI00221EE9EA|nr:uncharacterized protein GGS23DRAFT_597845 [Durotheca rogersii]KAI5862231.1 hypothetical protein GGS23DRAFT_597845 [Durotheca rogersii]
MSSNYAWTTIPLGDALESFVRTLPAEKQDELERPDQWDKLLAILSEAQINSFRVLLLWKSKLFAGPGASATVGSDDSLPGNGHPRFLEDALIVFKDQRKCRPDFDQYGGLLYGDEVDYSDRESIVTDDFGPTNSFDEVMTSLEYGETKPGALDNGDNNATALHSMRDMAAAALSYRIFLTGCIASCNIAQFENHYPHHGYLALEKLIQKEVGFAEVGWMVKGAAVDMHPRVPWPVPENTKFDIRALPDGLRLLCRRCKCRYAWVDLFCIPQDRSQRSQIEIARQAAIFGGAAVAVTWQNDTESWTMAQLSIRWMVLARLRKTQDLPLYTPGDLDSVYLSIAKELSTVTERLNSMHIPDFLEYRKGIKSEAIPEAINTNWFTSLWTLQEAFMRTDMVFVNRNWEVLTVDDRLPVSLDALVSLASSCMSIDSCPAPVAWLIDLLMDTNMIAFKRQHPISILSTACARHCQDSRTEAIIRPGEEQSLVLGRYAYGFLEEIRGKEGFLFFSSQYASFNEFQFAQDEQRPMGTILLFSRKKEWVYMDTKFFYKAYVFVTQKPHPSVKTWTLQPDGSVRIPGAGIIYATSARPGGSGQEVGEERGGAVDSRNSFDAVADLEVDFVGPEAGGPIDLTEFKTPLRSWMGRAFTDSLKYAVYISAGVDLQGFVLKEINVPARTSRPNERILAKIADFDFPLRRGADARIEVGCPPTTPVDWIVY